jgi:hypothetical protein
MENRERDRVSQRDAPTEAGELNRKVEEERGKALNSGTDAEFGQSIGRSENLEGGHMDNNRKNKGSMGNSDSSMGGESSRNSNSGSSYGSSTGRSGSVGNMGGGGSDFESSSDRSSRQGNRDSNSEIGNTRSSRGDSSSGRH